MSAAKLRAVKDEAAEAERAALLVKLKAEHRRAYELDIVVDGEPTLFVFKAPDALRWNAFESIALYGADPKAIPDAVHNLVVHCLVHPSEERIATLFDDFPALRNQISAEIARVARGEAGARAKKL